MINIPRYNSANASEDKQAYSDFVSECAALQSFTQHTLKPSAGGEPIYGYSLGNPDNPKVVIDGSIHNPHEWKSAYSVLEFMKVLNDPSLFSVGESVINELKQRYYVFCIPVVSPDSYIHSSRGNANNVALDFNFDYNREYTISVAEEDGTPGAYPLSERETQNISDAVLSGKTQIYINTHTLGDNNPLYMVRRNKDPIVDGVINAMRDDAVVAYADYDKQVRKDGLNRASSSYNWAGYQRGYKDEFIAATVFEPSYGLTMQQNRSIAVYGYTYLILNIADALSKIVEKKNKFFFSDYLSVV